LASIRDLLTNERVAIDNLRKYMRTLKDLVAIEDEY